MNRFRITSSMAAVIAFPLLLASCARSPAETALRGITRGENATLRIEWKGTVFYVDPIGSVPSEQADAVFVSHRHSDHYDKIAISNLGESVPVYAPFDATGITSFPVGEKREIFGIGVETVPSYNAVKTQYHPRRDGNAGFIFTLGETRVYVAGDTERIPEMKEIECDIAVVPLGQVYTMLSVEDAVESVLDSGASIGVPTHYGSAEGTESDAQRFKDLLIGKGAKSVFLQPLELK